MGGLANGIAGVGAGVATAADAQVKNASIRKQNEANMRAAMPAYMSLSGNATSLRHKAEDIDKEIKLLDEKLIADVPESEIMSLLSFENETVDISESGAVMITVTVKAKEKLFIFDNVPATVDGTFLAHLYQGGREVGTAKMVLPVNGVTDKTGVAGMILSKVEKGATYSVKYTPYKLWMMEA